MATKRLARCGAGGRWRCPGAEGPQPCRCRCPGAEGPQQCRWRSLSAVGVRRRLGLARSSARARSGAQAAAGQRFAFLIVLDFEATCWGDRGRRGPEISECTEPASSHVSSLCVFLVLPSF